MGRSLTCVVSAVKVSVTVAPTGELSGIRSGGLEVVNVSSSQVVWPVS